MGILDSIRKTLGGKRSANGADAPTDGSSEPPQAGHVAAASADPIAGTTYVVQSGDTLWKIANRAYGDGSRYPKIFEANRDVLNQPEHILPGQQLVIPPPGD